MLSYVSGAFDRFRTPPATREDQNIRRLMLQTALAGVVNGGIATFLPIFLVRLGATPVTVSLLTALPALLTILFSLPAGALVARWTRLVPPSARWYYGLRFCYLAVAIVGLLDPTWAPALIIVIWGLSAVPSTFANTAWYSVLAEAVSPRRRPAVNGVRWALLGLISAASVAAFGQLLETLPFPGNYLLVFVLSFAAGILNVWFYSQIEIPDRPFPPVSPSPLPLRAQAAELLRPLLEGGEFIRFSAVTFVLRLGLYFPAGLYSVFWVRDLQASDAWIGWRTTVGNVALMVGYYFWGRVAARRGHLPVLVLATVGLGAYPLLTGLTTPSLLPLLLVAALIWGLFASGIDVSLFEGLLAVTPDDRRPHFVAMNTALANLVAFGAPIVGAAAAQQAGIPPVLFVSSVCLLASAALVVLWRQKGG